MTTTPETVAAEFPDEPPDSSVVVDSEGLAWQLRPNLIGSGHWLACVHTAENCEVPRAVHRGGFRFGLTWGQLLVDRGPLTIVHRGEERA